jgi:hypothetical protein
VNVKLALRDIFKDMFFLPDSLIFLSLLYSFFFILLCFVYFCYCRSIFALLSVLKKQAKNKIIFSDLHARV